MGKTTSERFGFKSLHTAENRCCCLNLSIIKCFLFMCDCKIENQKLVIEEYFSGKKPRCYSSIYDDLLYQTKDRANSTEIFGSQLINDNVIS